MSEAHAPSRRLAGVTVPLFSLRSHRSWGIGEIADLPEFGQWVRDAGIRLIQILPLGEISGNETSPYAALTAFGIDPMYIALADVADLGPDVTSALGGASGALLLSRAKASAAIDYEAVRTLKRQALRFGFERFTHHDLPRSTPRAAAFQAFREQSREWLDDYALFRALKDEHGGVAWWEWDEALQRRDPDALAEARSRTEQDALYYAYAQWLAHSQWYEARTRLAAIGVEVMGDLPFMVGRDSADVWANQSEFRDDASVGAPPDPFNDEGQEWGLPPYHWDRMRKNDFTWLRRRVRYTGSLYDRFRIDHLVGFYRTYIRPRAALVGPPGKLAPGVFDPATPEAQLEHGERVITAMTEAAQQAGATLIAEDLGAVPDFVRKSLTRLRVPGYKVLIWEKDANVFRDPLTYPAVSVACFGTHDTAPVAIWWEGLDNEARAAVKKIPLLVPHSKELGPAFTPLVHRALVDVLNASASELVLFLIQDVLGTRERINTPATTGSHNWSYRLPGTVDELRRDRYATQVVTMVRQSIEKNRRA
jgi:4-alpha-glucanotransferase